MKNLIRSIGLRCEYQADWKISEKGKVFLLIFIQDTLWNKEITFTIIIEIKDESEGYIDILITGIKKKYKLEQQISKKIQQFFLENKWRITIIPNKDRMKGLSTVERLRLRDFKI